MPVEAASTFRRLISMTRGAAFHLDQHGAHLPGDLAFSSWKTRLPLAEDGHGWRRLVRSSTARGVSFRRVRVVSEPLAPSIVYAYAVTEQLNAAAGLEVRWLPRPRAAGLVFPRLDCWIFDDRAALLYHFDAFGEIERAEVTFVPGPIDYYRLLFAAAWDRAVPHQEYRPGAW
ncbi:DUF6879 family protein [Nocardiopsis halophila]|uniref:DUF6879 family protein n=1 Tax=Nocardiopsis halophila TaxID=141692 RepID=UPI00034B4AC3|nr:DUF6879 family protein [Nocardiopsis halophila]